MSFRYRQHRGWRRALWQTQPKGTETRRESQPLLLRSTIVILDLSLLDEVGTYAEERNPARGASSEEL